MESARGALAANRKFAPEAWKRLEYRLRFEPSQRRPSPSSREREVRCGRRQAFTGYAVITAGISHDCNRYVSEWDALDKVLVEGTSFRTIDVHM